MARTFVFFSLLVVAGLLLPSSMFSSISVLIPAFGCPLNSRTLVCARYCFRSHYLVQAVFLCKF